MTASDAGLGTGATEVASAPPPISESPALRPGVSPKRRMSRGLTIGIVVFAVLVLGTFGYFSQAGGPLNPIHGTIGSVQWVESNPLCSGCVTILGNSSGFSTTNDGSGTVSGRIYNNASSGSEIFYSASLGAEQALLTQFYISSSNLPVSIPPGGSDIVSVTLTFPQHATHGEESALTIYLS